MLCKVLKEALDTIFNATDDNKFPFAIGLVGLVFCALVAAGVESNKTKKFEIVLVGPNGEVLRKYWETIGAIYKYNIPSTQNGTDDILTCDNLTILTKV